MNKNNSHKYASFILGWLLILKAQNIIQYQTIGFHGTAWAQSNNGDGELKR